MTEPPTTSEGTTPRQRQISVTRTQVVNGLRWLAIAVVVGFAIHQLSQHWTEFWTTLGDIPWESAVLSQVMVIASLAATVYGWQVIIDHLGAPVGYRRSSQIFLVGQLGKYVPGSVWGYLLQMELGKQAGLARARVFVASLVHLGVIMVSAMVAGLIALPVIFDTSPNARWMLALIPIGLVALHPRVLTWGTSLVLRLLRKPALEHTLSGAMVGKSLGASGVAKVLHGLHLWLLANSVGAPGWTGLALCVGAMALAMTAGTVAFIFPAGAGAREVVIVAVLVAAGIGQVEALAFAAVSRVMFLVADLITAGGAAITARSTLRAAAPR
ncbi:lysylphosphatidylglycerol synthase transmembrane domain-containing protein [Haloechinothrix salitolerans]|uniref:Lysylphosphatidylglycerol synthase transmembrane domain-containing protein n=1 Tax=Haloechinothrix salitolerans TaxID=926830 RepID=A0ABW2CAU0_9PSEU